VTGEYLTPDSDIFGEQYSRPFPLAIVLQADHHAIGIDGQHVMQFSDPEKRGQNKINWTTFKDFLNGQPPTHLLYPELSDDRHRLEARNRALKAFLYSEKFGTYGLFSNNCEHFTHWCKTGESGIFTSDQVKELALNTAKAGAAAFMAGTLHRPPPPWIIKHVSDYIRKHARSPGSYFK
jgi:Lecithin retinol acyltransferase